MSRGCVYNVSKGYVSSRMAKGCINECQKALFVNNQDNVA